MFANYRKVLKSIITYFWALWILCGIPPVSHYQPAAGEQAGCVLQHGAGQTADSQRALLLRWMNERVDFIQRRG